MKNVTKIFIFLFVFSGILAVAPAVLATYNNCQNHNYQACNGNNLYWYDSCDNLQEVAQYCQNGCYNDICQNNNNNHTNHAYRLCFGNSVYWYDSLGNQQDLYQNCNYSNLTCQYGQCVYQPIINPAPAPRPPYYAHYSKKCSGSNIYWYDSLGVQSGLYKNCSDSNTCTVDSCSAEKCVNALKCDGSTCFPSSDDYKKYCQPAEQQNQNQNQGANLSGFFVSFFAKQDANSPQWQKAVDAISNSSVYFMISAANNGSGQIASLKISANIPEEISSLGNLQVNGTATQGDIISGIDIGSLAPGVAKTITFEGRTQGFSAQGQKQATAIATVSGAAKSDSLNINLLPGPQIQVAASNTTTSGFVAFLKRWYVWILAGIVLIFLFIVVFRRLSSNT